VLDPSGQGLLLMGSISKLGQADWGAIALVTVTAAIGISALAGGLQGWLIGKAGLLERCALILAGLLVVYPTAASDIIGIAIIVAVLAVQWLRRGRPQSA